ncbi:conserved hypothetical protein [Frankia canadensis]|uniref:Uncharacterized protein n=1 Tax=Frankia canadensis TaxID=1836972 RepID=A0A2I2KMG3_9ACTN|nr:hypothetical protein [Frankia canadensis]SNQ46855.1 conserved hypothetical protein [Frankia canadensis]SOU54145.1 conserved hypothetical protein [Frankia canadensis]
MSLATKPGARFRSAVDATEIIVVKPAKDPVDLRCGGQPMVALGDDVPGGLALDPAFAGGTQLGKRFADTDTGLELLCTKGGEGSLSIGQTPLPLKDAKPLPSSD